MATEYVISGQGFSKKRFLVLDDTGHPMVTLVRMTYQEATALRAALIDGTVPAALVPDADVRADREHLDAEASVKSDTMALQSANRDQQRGNWHRSGHDNGGFDTQIWDES